MARQVGNVRRMYILPPQELDKILADKEVLSAEKEALASESGRELLAEIREDLSEKEWRIFVLFCRGHSHAKIAKAVGSNITVNAAGRTRYLSVDNGLCRIRTKLTRLLEARRSREE